MYVGDVAPEGWLLCDGSQYSCATYPDLSNALISDGTNFNVPDMGMRIPIGSNGDDLTFSNNNYNDISSGTTNIDVNHLPTHNHDISTNISFNVDENTYSYQNDSSNVIVDVSFVRTGVSAEEIPYFPFAGQQARNGGQTTNRFEYINDAAFVMADDYFNTNTHQSGNVDISYNLTSEDKFYPKYTSINFIIKT